MRLYVWGLNGLPQATLFQLSTLLVAFRNIETNALDARKMLARLGQLHVLGRRSTEKRAPLPRSGVPLHRSPRINVLDPRPAPNPAHAGHVVRRQLRLLLVSSTVRFPLPVAVCTVDAFAATVCFCCVWCFPFLYRLFAFRVNCPFLCPRTAFFCMFSWMIDISSSHPLWTGTEKDNNVDGRRRNVLYFLISS